VKRKAAFPITVTVPAGGGWQFRTRIELHKDHLTAKTSVLRNGRPATKRETELCREAALMMPAFIIKGLAKAAGEEKVATKMAQWLDQYQRAVYQRRSSKPSPEREEAASFLMGWRRETLAAQESGERISDSNQIKLLNPLLTALDKLNVEFFKGLIEAVQILSNRIYNSKDGSGRDVRKWLLEYKLLTADGSPKYTVRELNEQFVSKFRAIKDKKLREKCRKLGVPLKDDVRGAGAVRRKRQCPPDAAKKG
jgi:hypothetical protein